MTDDTTEPALHPNAEIVAILAAKAARHARQVEWIFGEPGTDPVDHDRVSDSPRPARRTPMGEQSAWQRRAELEAEVDAARVEEQRIGLQRQDADARAKRLRAQLAERPAGEYDEVGRPVPKSEAARLTAELDATKGTAFADRIRAAKQRTRRARIALDRDAADHLRELVADREPDARQAVADLDDLLELLDRKIVKFAQFAQSWSRVINPITGLDMRTELPTYDQLSGLRRVLRGYRNSVELPLPKSIVTPEGEQPPRVQYKGGWVSPANAEVSAEQDRRRTEHPDAQRTRRNPPAPVR
jgi:hypothetical protein